MAAKKPKPVTRAYQPGSGALSGEDHGRAVLTEAVVMSIRQLIRNGASVVDIARTVGVAPATISKAARGLTWAHLPGAIEETRTSVRVGALSKTDRKKVK